jgi:DNA (cytosine-5)-methyltransferase 1
MTLTHGSLFSGVGGFDLGADAAGIETLWQCEIDKRPRSVLKKHWPNATQYTDVKELNGAKLKPVDIISFGSPCQDLSIAGKGAGLQGDRSGLFFEAIRIIKEMRDATQNQYPKIAIWENVRGALSSNGGRDFDSAIRSLAALGSMEIGYRVVNTCNFGPPQRRVRVFVIADLAGRRAGQILSKPTSVLWHPDKGREAGKETSGEAQDRTRTGEWTTSRVMAQAMTAHNGGPDLKHADAGHLVFSTAGWLQSDITGTVSSKWAKGTGGPSGDGHYNLVMEQTLSYDGYNAAESDQLYHTLRTGYDVGDCVATPSIAITERWGKEGGGKGLLLTEEASPTLRTAVNQVVAAPDQSTYRVRRLTPVECERLQGWPDDHTRYDDQGRELSDSARYKMIGNGISAPVAQWLCQNVVEALTSSIS